MISIHALREEGDATGAYCRAKADDFYPRPPRGGRPLVVCDDLRRGLISIHALREEGDLAKIIGHALNAISIHALREEGDPARIPLMSTAMHFYPRPPRGGRPTKQVVRSAGINFYPRPPRGGRRFRACPGCFSERFLSTPSARRATFGSVKRPCK